MNIFINNIPYDNNQKSDNVIFEGQIKDIPENVSVKVIIDYTRVKTITNITTYDSIYLTCIDQSYNQCLIRYLLKDFKPDDIIKICE